MGASAGAERTDREEGVGGVDRPWGLIAWEG